VNAQLTKRFADKTVIVTGGGGSIGRAIASLFAAEGASVVIADLAAPTAREAAARITEAGAKVRSIPVDVTDPAQVESLIEQTIEAFGTLDVLVNNAGVGLNRPFLCTTPEEWDRVIRVNLTGTFLCAHAAARAMIRQGHGNIVNVASISGQRGAQGRAAYGASKAGVILLTKVMALELAPRGVRVNAVAPGPVATDMTRVTHTPEIRRSYCERIPMSRYATCEEIAAAVLFLASADASFVAGHTLNVDGGFVSAGLMFDTTGGDEAQELEAALPGHDIVT
jgi:NAD(P)-dependent dehydrogenase (short-subunit alcohol dehydrogenase family)